MWTWRPSRATHTATWAQTWRRCAQRRRCRWGRLGEGGRRGAPFCAARGKRACAAGRGDGAALAEGHGVKVDLRCRCWKGLPQESTRIPGPAPTILLPPGRPLPAVHPREDGRDRPGGRVHRRRHAPPASCGHALLSRPSSGREVLPVGLTPACDGPASCSLLPGGGHMRRQCTCISPSRHQVAATPPRPSPLPQRCSTPWP